MTNIKELHTQQTSSAKTISKEMRSVKLPQVGATIWLTGLSAAGKTTTAYNLEHALLDKGIFTRVLDGDCVRDGLSSDLGFSAKDRSENIRRIGEVAKLFNESGVITIVSFISPYHRDRQMVRTLHARDNLPFLEVFVDTPIDVCETRDPKGLYEKARKGELKNFTGIDDAYETPESPELIIHPDQMTPQQCADAIAEMLRKRELIQLCP